MIREGGEVVAIVGGEGGAGDQDGSRNHTLHPERSFAASRIEEESSRSGLRFIEGQDLLKK